MSLSVTVLRKLRQRQHVMHAMNEQSVVVTKRVGAGFARIVHAPRASQRLAIREKFALAEQVRADHPGAGVHQLCDFWLK